MEKKEDKKESPESKTEEHETLETHNKLMKFLNDSKVKYTMKTHEASKTAEEAAAKRGTPLCSGAKSMLVKDNSKSSVKDLVFLLKIECKIVLFSCFIC